MSAQVVCDTVPPPLSPGERVGGALPAAPQPAPDSAVVIGTVVEAGSGRPLSGASVGLVASSAPTSPYEPLARAVTNREAGFVIVAPRPGRYSLVAHLIGHPPARADVTLAAGKATVARLEMHYQYCPGY